MYERSAIVLERYFENLLDYRRECNLRDNFNNYCELIEKLEKFQINYQKEIEATQEYNDSLRKIKSVQLAQDKLYKKSAKMEYNRNLLFNNIDGKVDDTRKCIEKIELDVEKNNEAMKDNKENLLSAMTEFNDKKFELSKCKRYKKMAENEYNEIYEVAKKNFEGITQENLDTAKGFAKFDDNDSIIEILDKNGKGEKIPFNSGVINSATKLGVDMSKKEVASYLVIYDKMSKLLNEIENGNARVELHKKYARNEKAKVDFVLAVKEYIFQFLDYERMTVIHGRKSHNRLMSEACENFNTDIIQINNLFSLLVKEITNKATKKAYKELYNKSYVIEIKQKEEKFKKEKNRVNLNTATLINSNYWRIEGIKNIYTVFYKNVSEVFGKEVAEFDIPKETDEDMQEEQEDVKLVQEKAEAPVVEEEKPKVPKMPFEIKERSYSDEEDEYEEELEENDSEYDNDYEDEEEYEEYSEEDYDEENDYDEEDSDEYEEDEYEDDEYTEDEDEDEEISENPYTAYDEITEEEIEEAENFSEEEEFDIFGEKYQETDFIEKSVLEAKKQVESEDIFKDEEESIFANNPVKASFFDDDDTVFENNEEDIFGNVKIQRNSNKNEIEDMELTKEEKNQNGIFKKLRKISRPKKNAVDNIW